MSIQQIGNRLACPICRQILTLSQKYATCSNRHSFDIAGYGYLNLSNAPQPRNADSSAMLAARSRIQAEGIFAPIAAKLAELTAAHSSILEAGAGTGYYLGACLNFLDSTPGQLDEIADSRVGVGLDVSTAAARLIAKRGIPAIVADVWKPLPLIDESFDAILSIFAPRNLPEFARVLKPGGSLLVVTPNSGHLAALRERYDLLKIATDKDERLDSTYFQLENALHLRYQIELTATQAADLIAMGPNAFHQSAPETKALTDHIDVTLRCYAKNT